MDLHKSNLQAQVTKVTRANIKPAIMVGFSSLLAVQALVTTANPFKFSSAWKGASIITEGGQKVLSVAIPKQGQPKVWPWCPPELCGG